MKKSLNLLKRKGILLVFFFLLSSGYSFGINHYIGLNVSSCNLSTLNATDVVILDPGTHVPITFYGQPINGSDGNRILITNGDGQVSFTGIADQLILFDHAKYIRFKGNGYQGLSYGIECYSPQGATEQNGIVIGEFSGYIEICQINIHDIKGFGILTDFKFYPGIESTWYSYSNSDYKAIISDLHLWDNIIESIDSTGILLGDVNVNTPYIVTVDNVNETVYCPRLFRPISIYHNHLSHIGKNGIAIYGANESGSKIFSNTIIDYGTNIPNDENPRCDFAAIVIGESCLSSQVFSNIIRDGKGHGILEKGEGKTFYCNNIISRPGYNNDIDIISAFQMNQTCEFITLGTNENLFYIYHNTIVDPKTNAISYLETVNPHKHEIVYNIIALNDVGQEYFEGTYTNVIAYCQGIDLNSKYPTLAEAHFVNPYTNNKLLPLSSAINKVIDNTNPLQFEHPCNDYRHCNNGNGGITCPICNNDLLTIRTDPQSKRPDHGAYESPYRSPLYIISPTTTYFGIKFPSLTKAAICGARTEDEDFLAVACIKNDTIKPVACIMWNDSIRDIVAYKNDSTGEGYVENSTLLFYYFDASEDKYIELYAEYDSTYSNQGQFVTNDSCKILNLYQKQVIPLKQGWNIFSTYIAPFDSTIVSVFKAIEANVNVVCNYDTCYAPNQYNGIEFIEPGKAYKVNMISADTLVVIGDGILPELSPIPLTQTGSDWNLLGMLRNSVTDIEYVFENCISNLDNVKIIKNQNGVIYWPQYGLDFIDTLMPGQGYEVNMYSPDTLLYPANDTLIVFKTTRNANPSCKYFNTPKPTGISLALGIDIDAWDYLPQVGDEIAVVNSKNKVVGCAVFNGENLALTVWGLFNENENEIGLKQGEGLHLILYSSQSNSIEDLNVETWLDNESSFEANSIRIIKKVNNTNSKDPDLSADISIFPNPAGEEISIEFVTDCSKEIIVSIFDIKGNCIQLNKFKGIAGKNSLNYPIQDLKSGCYTLKIQIGGTLFNSSSFVKK